MDFFVIYNASKINYKSLRFDSYYKTLIFDENKLH